MGNCLKYNNSDDISLLRNTEGNAQDTLPSRLEQQQQQQHLSNSFYDTLQPPAVFYPTPSVSRPLTHLSEDEQVKIAKRIGLIQHLPIGNYDVTKKTRECVICMVDFCIDEAVRFLPCMHIYHVHCIDDWLMRSLTCPSCMEPVDAALLTSYQTN